MLSKSTPGKRRKKNSFFPQNLNFFHKKMNPHNCYIIELGDLYVNGRPLGQVFDHPQIYEDIKKDKRLYSCENLHICRDTDCNYFNKIKYAKIHDNVDLMVIDHFKPKNKRKSKVQLQKERPKLKRNNANAFETQNPDIFSGCCTNDEEEETDLC